MIQALFPSTIALAAAMALAGAGFGLIYFSLLRRTVALYSANSRLLLPAALTLGRMAGAVLLLALAARRGALPLLAAALGFLLARAIALRTAHRSC